MKKCKKCLLEKPINAFGIRRQKVWHTCKECWNRYASTKRPKMLSVANKFNKGIRVAKRKNIQWTLTFEEYVALISQVCAYCNGKLGQLGATGVGLDQIKAGLGYIIGNVAPCCTFCNRIKSDFLTADETKAIVTLLIKLRTYTTHEQ